MNNIILKIYTNENNSKFNNFIKELKVNRAKIDSYNINLKIIKTNNDLIAELNSNDKVLYRTRNPNINNIFNKLGNNLNIKKKNNLKKMEMMLKKYYKLKSNPKNNSKSLKTIKKWFRKNQIGGSKYEYIDYNIIKKFIPLVKKRNLKNEIDFSFLKNYKKYKVDYLENQKINNTNWRSLRNNFIKNILNNTETFYDSNNLPTKEHLKLIMWGYTPNLDKLKDSILKI